MGVRKLSNIGGWTSKTSYTSMLAGNAVFEPWAPSGAYDSIATTTVGAGGSASVTFSSIPQTYTHLQLRVLSRTNNAGNFIYGYAGTANSDSGANYAYHLLYGNGSAAGAVAGSSQTYLNAVDTVANGFTAGVFAASIVDILDYSSTSKYKTFRHIGGADGNGSGQIDFGSALWMSTSAITTLTFSSDTLLQYSSFALYGIKGGN